MTDPISGTLMGFKDINPIGFNIPNVPGLTNTSLEGVLDSGVNNNPFVSNTYQTSDSSANTTNAPSGYGGILDLLSLFGSNLLGSKKDSDTAVNFDLGFGKNGWGNLGSWNTVVNGAATIGKLGLGYLNYLNQKDMANFQKDVYKQNIQNFTDLTNSQLMDQYYSRLSGASQAQRAQMEARGPTQITNNFKR